jgi:cutinase
MKLTLLLPTLFLRATALPQLFGGTTSCGPVAVLFARGTFEPGSYGATVGSEFTTALQAILPFGSQFYGVDYSAGVTGYMTGGGLDGITAMRAKAESFMSKCPGIKLVMGG